MSSNLTGSTSLRSTSSEASLASPLFGRSLFPPAAALALPPPFLYRPPLILEFQAAARGPDPPALRLFLRKDAKKMADTDIFYCEPRERVGTGGARASRRDGWVPGVLYGGTEGPVPIRLRQAEIMKAYSSGRLRAHLAKIDVPGEEGQQPVIARAVQVHPVKGQPIHVDFMRVDETTRIDIKVPVRFVNEEDSPGLKRGGVLNVVRHAIEVYAPATAIPAFFEADVADLDIGDALHVSAIAMPQGVTLVTTDRDYTIVTIAAPSAVRSAEEEEAAEAAAAEAAEAAEGEEGQEGAEDGGEKPKEDE